MKKISILITFFLFSFLVKSQEIEKTKFWKEYTTFQGIKIEYKFAECSPNNGRKQTLVLFRYTNTTQEKIELTWKSDVWRDNICTTCASTSSEHNKSLTLIPNETIEADGSSKRIKNRYLFDHFSKLVPGMTEQKITKFEFKNLTKKTL